MKYKFILILLLTPFIILKAQDDRCGGKSKKIKIKKYLKLPKTVDETSGLILWGDYFLTHNDSGGEPVIYKIDKTTGELAGTIRVANAQNRDWEDITQDKNYIYVGDFGNNGGRRKDLRIYKISKKDLRKKHDTVKASIIRFRYAEQKNFHHKAYKHNFDCEAMTVFHDSLWLFSKNWENHKTRLYKLPKEPGDYTISTLQTCNVKGLITGAYYQKGRHTLCLIGYIDYRPFMIVDKGFDGKLSRQAKKFRIKDRRFSQTEGICMDKAGNIYISSEKTKRFKQKIYHYKFSQKHQK